MNSALAGAFPHYSPGIMAGAAALFWITVLLGARRVVLPRPSGTGNRLDMLAAALVLLVCCFTPLARGADARTDDVEYLVMARRLFEEGRAYLTLHGAALPARYPPWFPMLVLTPAYYVFGSHPGAAVIGVGLLAVVGALAAYRLGLSAGNRISGVLALACLMLLPDYRGYAGRAMTDVPAAALLLLEAVLYVQMATAPDAVRKRIRDFALPGLLAAFAAALRPLSGLALLPFLVLLLRSGTQRRAAKLAALCLPAVVLGAAGLLYQKQVYGSYLRSGYNFWTAVPYDFPSLVLSPRYAAENLELLAHTFLPHLIGLWLIAAVLGRKSGSARIPAALWIFCAYAAAPVFVLQLCYFFCDSRLVLPVQVFIAVFCGIALGALVGCCKAGGETRTVLAVLGLVLATYAAVPRAAPVRWRAAERLRARTPADALIISAINPAYLEEFVTRGSSREVLPVSRRVEFAGKFIMRRSARRLTPPPRDCWDHRSPGLRQLGAEEAFPATALEQPELIRNAAAAKRPVYIDATLMRDNELAELKSRCTLLEEAEELYRVEGDCGLQ